MKERPILFSAPMVRAILDGSKSQTRRALNPQPDGGIQFGGIAAPHDVLNGKGNPLVCKFGQPGDRLWVKETFRFTSEFDGDSPTRVGERCIDAGYARPWAPIQYDADSKRRDWKWVGTQPPSHEVAPGKTRVSIHMPRWASRITLEVTGVRAEHLNECSEEDAIAEGLIRSGDGWRGALDLPWFASPVAAYRSLWENLNGAGSWDANPWVWVIQFRTIAA